jgi:hypothetical protein
MKTNRPKIQKTIESLLLDEWEFVLAPIIFNNTTPSVTNAVYERTKNIFEWNDFSVVLFEDRNRKKPTRRL